MGYFSNLDLEKDELCYYDHSYPTHNIQLQWRIEDLFNRLEELRFRRCILESFDYSDSRLLRKSIEFTLPECLSNVDDIITAIELANDELQLVSDDYQCHSPIVQEESVSDQITIWECIEREKESIETSNSVAA